MNVLVFDIETIPDVPTGRRLHNLHNLSDQEVAQVMLHQRRQENGSDFLRHHLHRIVAISAVLRTPTTLKVWSLGELDADEAELIRRFFAGIEKYTPTLISWNGGSFDLPVLHYRSLHHGIAAPRYWEIGDDDREFRYNNYLSRYHYRHTDLMDVLAAYQPRAVAPLDEIAQLLGLPGKMGMSGAHVWEAYQRGELAAIRNYCATDVMNTYLVYLRFELIRGRLTSADYTKECLHARQVLEQENTPHWREFLAAWEIKPVV